MRERELLRRDGDAAQFHDEQRCVLPFLMKTWIGCSQRGRVSGINYGPYGADGSQDVTSSFVWDGNDKAPVEFAGRMGLLYFSGRGWDAPL